jgi:hypothetical protein
MTINIISKVNDTGNGTWREVITALGLSTGAAVALGLSRFAYGLLLPPMRADLGWTYVEAGALNTANGAGYIVGALVAAWTARRWGTARAFLAGFSASVLVLLLTAATTRFPVFIALRTVGGISTALTFILGAGLAAAICPMQNPRRRGTLVGLYVAGVGIGILLGRSQRSRAGRRQHCRVESPRTASTGAHVCRLRAVWSRLCRLYDVHHCSVAEATRQQRTGDLVLACSGACFSRNHALWRERFPTPREISLQASGYRQFYWVWPRMCVM